jgi:hypothetical protein
MVLTCEHHPNVALESLRSCMLLENDNYFKSNQMFEPEWIQLNDTEVNLKRVLINQTAGYFAKLYAPCTNGYAQRTSRALLELSTIRDLSVPVLLPLATDQNILLFPIGTFSGFICGEMGKNDCFRYKKMYQLMKPVAERYRLFLANPIDIIDIEGKRYLADVFEDVDVYLTS